MKDYGYQGVMRTHLSKEERKQIKTIAYRQGKTPTHYVDDIIRDAIRMAQHDTLTNNERSGQ